MPGAFALELQMFVEYPKALYKQGDETLEWRVVQSAFEEAASNGDGFFPIGCAPHEDPAIEPESADDSTDEKASLVAKLLDAGVEIDRRWGLKRLGEEVAKLNA